MDCLTRTVLSLEIGAVKNPNVNFIQMGYALFPVWRTLINEKMPMICRLLNISLCDPKAMDFFLKITMDTIEQRDKTKEYPCDVLGQMMKIRDATPENPMTSDTIARTLMQFFLDGFDTFGSLLTMAFYHLTVNQEVQEKLFQEIASVTNNKDGEIIDLEKFKTMDYLDRLV